MLWTAGESVVAEAYCERCAKRSARAFARPCVREAAGFTRRDRGFLSILQLARLKARRGSTQNETPDTPVWWVGAEPAKGPVGVIHRPQFLVSPNVRRLAWAALGLTGFVVAARAVLGTERGEALAPPAKAHTPTTLPSTRPRPVAHTASQANTVIVLVVDGVRWQEIFTGVDAKLARRHGMRAERLRPAAKLVPHLTRLRTELGASIGAPGVGQPMVASGPAFQSLPGYMELLSGKPAPYCQNNRCGSVRYATLMDEVSRVSSSLGDAALFASWPHLIHAAALEPERVLISAGRKGGTHLERLYRSPERAELRRAALRAGPSPSKGDFRGDTFTARLALDYLVSERPRFLFVSLGETDTYAHAGNYPAYLNALTKADRVIGDFTSIVQRLNLAGHRTTLVVTTDHGRDKRARDHGAAAPESARVWLVASGYAVHRRGAVPSPFQRRLADVAPSVRRLLGLGEPREQPGLSELFVE